jgi:hypothetical protein
VTTETTPQPLPHRRESGMHSRAINAAAGVLLDSQQRHTTTTGQAIDLDCAGLLNSPEHADEVERMRQRLAELEDAQATDGTYPPALPWAALMDHEDLADFLDELAAAAIANATSEEALAEVEATCGQWRMIAEAQHAHNTAPGPDEAPIAYMLTEAATAVVDDVPALQLPALTVTCPYCAAKPGALCTDGTRTRCRDVHQARTLALSSVGTEQAGGARRG